MKDCTKGSRGPPGPYGRRRSSASRGNRGWRWRQRGRAPPSWPLSCPMVPDRWAANLRGNSWLPLLWQQVPNGEMSQLSRDQIFPFLQAAARLVYFIFVNSFACRRPTGIDFLSWSLEVYVGALLAMWRRNKKTLHGTNDVIVYTGRRLFTVEQVQWSCLGGGCLGFNGSLYTRVYRGIQPWDRILEVRASNGNHATTYWVCTRDELPISELNCICMLQPCRRLYLHCNFYIHCVVSSVICMHT